MSQTTTRVLALLELLQSHGRMNGAELASRIGGDRRTLRRYIVMLEEIGIPITTELGRHGIYALVAGFKLPPMMFTEDEALAISLGLVAARGLGLSEGTPAVASTHAIEVFINTDLKHAKDHLYDTTGLFEASDDGVIVRAQADDLAWFARQLASLPFEFEMIKPRALRVALKAYAQKLLKRAK
jgi:predicted DNA-binding transcriptional regulator YafY